MTVQTDSLVFSSYLTLRVFEPSFIEALAAASLLLSSTSIETNAPTTADHTIMLSSLAPLSLLLATLQVRAAPTQELPGAAASSGSSQQDEGNESSSYGTVSLDGDKSAKAIIASQDGKVSGTVTLKWLPDAGTAFSVDIQGLYDASAQYKWHIHEMPV